MEVNAHLSSVPNLLAIYKHSGGHNLYELNTITTIDTIVLLNKDVFRYTCINYQKK